MRDKSEIIREIVDGMDRKRPDGSSNYYNRRGQPISYAEWMDAQFNENGTYNPDAGRVAYDQLGETEVSTVWLGANLRWSAGPPLIFETAVFAEDGCHIAGRYTTEEEAKKGHARAVTAARALSSPNE